MANRKLRDRSRYIQICRENEYSTLYYDRVEEKLLRYKKESKFSFSLKYQLCVLAMLYLGYVLNAKFHTVLFENVGLKNFIIFICLTIGIMCLVLFENYIAQNLKTNGIEVTCLVSDNLLQIGKKNFKTQKIIIYIWTIVSIILLLLFYVTNFIMMLLLFLISIISLSGMVATIRPVLRTKVYQCLEKRNNIS